MKEARITINPRGIGVLAFRLSSRRLSAPITTAALLGSVGAGSAFARPARNASDNELTLLWPAGLEIASPRWRVLCHKKPSVSARSAGACGRRSGPLACLRWVSSVSVNQSRLGNSSGLISRRREPRCRPVAPARRSTCVRIASMARSGFLAAGFRIKSVWRIAAAHRCSSSR